MSREMVTRNGTWDAAIVQAVRVENEYALPDDMSGMRVVDIGAHIGAFAMACVDRRAQVVHCYEADPENFLMLVMNLLPDSYDDAKRELELNVTKPLMFGGKTGLTEVTLAFSAVFTAEFDTLGLRRLQDHDHGVRNTGHVDVFGSIETGTVSGRVPVTDIRQVLGELPTQPQQKIDLLKLDCEGSEWAFFGRVSFKNVQQIVGELHPIPEQLAVSGLLSAKISTAAPELQPRSASVAVEGMLRQSGFMVTTKWSESVEFGLLGKIVAQKPEKPKVQAEVFDQPRLLWIGDAGTTTGYAKVTHQVCNRLKAMGWRIGVMGVGYGGDPHAHGYPIYPAYSHFKGGDLLGVARIKEIVEKVQPHVVLLLNDSWNVGTMLEQMVLQTLAVPTVGYVAVDSEHVRADVATQLRNLRELVAHTKFGVEQCRKAGYMGRASYVAHGVNTNLYKPFDRTLARKQAGMPDAPDQSTFIWGSVNVNQPRKRLDLVIAYFAAWWRQAGKPDAYLHIHTDKHGGAWDIGEISEWLGKDVHDRVIRTKMGNDLQEGLMPWLYSCYDAQLSVSEGESFGLTTLEGMACGVPQVAVNCGGLPYWADGIVRLVEPAVKVYTPNPSGSLRSIAAEGPYVAAMQELFADASLRAQCREQGLALAQELTWDKTAEHLHKALDRVVQEDREVIRAKADVLAEF